jgi:SAM-dependent methyltransferase
MGEPTRRGLPGVGGVRSGQGQDPRDLSTTGANGADPYSRLAGVYDEIVVDGCHDRWAAHLHELWSSDAADVRTVLDLCCGTGLMAAELIALGYRVVGVDRSAAMLARARQRVGPATVLRQQTLPGLTIGGVFDAAVCTFDALNYLTPADLGATLTAVGRRLRPGGWFVFDLHTDALMDFTLSHPVVEGEAAGYRFALNSVVDVGARTCDTRIDVTRAHDGDTFTERHRQYFHADVQVRDALNDAGLAFAAITDEYTHQPPDSSTMRATWTARYPAA